MVLSRQTVLRHRACEVEEAEELVSVPLGALELEELRSTANALLECTRCRNFIRMFPTSRAMRHYAVIVDSQEQMKPWPRGRKPLRLTASQVLNSLLFGPAPNQGCELTARPKSRAICGSESQGTASKWHRNGMKMALPGLNPADMGLSELAPRLSAPCRAPGGPGDGGGRGHAQGEWQAGGPRTQLRGAAQCGSGGPVAAGQRMRETQCRASILHTVYMCVYRDCTVYCESQLCWAELPRLLNEGKYSNVAGEQRFLGQ